MKFTQPTKEYEDATQQVLRNAVTGQLPDVTFQGLNRQRILADRGIAQPLDLFIAAEKDWAKAGYDGALLTLGQVKGKQYGMGFSLSTPIIYFNADLVKKAGGDPDNFPKTWDGIFALAKKINDLGQQDRRLPLPTGTSPATGCGRPSSSPTAARAADGGREEGGLRPAAGPEGDRDAAPHDHRRHDA